MNRYSTYLCCLSLALAILSGSCKKPAGDSPRRPNIISRTLRSVIVFRGPVVTSTTTYQYDRTGRVTRVDYVPGTNFTDYTYTDDNVATINAVFINPNTQQPKSHFFQNPVSVSENGDTMVVDYTRPSLTVTGIDTVIHTLVYDNNMLAEHSWYIRPAGLEAGHKRRYFQYNQDGNIVRAIEQVNDNPSYELYTVSKWDDKPNPRYNEPRLHPLFVELGLPVDAPSKNNPVEFTDNYGTHKIAMTYNQHGYPLTYKRDDLDYVSVELVYDN